MRPVISMDEMSKSHLITLFATHCECRPLDVDRTEDDHAACHDCDTGVLDDIQTAINAVDSEEQQAALFRCVGHWNSNLRSPIYEPRMRYAWDNARREGKDRCTTSAPAVSGEINMRAPAGASPRGRGSK